MQAGNENGNAPAAPDDILHVAFTLDMSGSMQIIEEAVVGGYNDYLRELAGRTDAVYAEHVRHDRQPRLHQPAAGRRRGTRPPPLPAGRLHSAVRRDRPHSHRTEQRLKATGRDEEKVLVVVLTDGLEDSSTDYDAHAIAELVRSFDQRPNWTFVYLGAAHHTMEAAKDAAGLISFKTDNAMPWTADTASTRMTMQALARVTGVRRRSTALKSERFFADAGQSQADYSGLSRPCQSLREGQRW
jgi:hypothetical protein